jgi:hypothetical protein
LLAWQVRMLERSRELRVGQVRRALLHGRLKIVALGQFIICAAKHVVV